jgi:hypothetical protein
MKAFLSHSSRDKPLVEDVAAHEIDSTTFDSGILNVDAIQAALKRTSIYVLFLTMDALRSSYVRFEAILAQELVAKGIIERFFVVCLDAHAFSKADEQWKSYCFVRHLTAPQPIARFIQNQLLLARARAGLKNQPYVERSKEQNDLKELLIQPGASPIKGIYISGNEGIGRRTFCSTCLQGPLSVSKQRIRGYPDRLLGRVRGNLPETKPRTLAKLATVRMARSGHRILPSRQRR